MHNEQQQNSVRHTNRLPTDFPIHLPILYRQVQRISKTSEAVLKSTPCFRKLIAFFVSSQSNRTQSPHVLYIQICIYTQDGLTE